jgi:hypothetical protein
MRIDVGISTKNPHRCKAVVKLSDELKLRRIITSASAEPRSTQDDAAHRIGSSRSGAQPLLRVLLLRRRRSA